MNEISWDPETGGILLKDSVYEGIKSEIRPVFHEELDLLGFNQSWSYPQCDEPLLWATSVGRRYFYRGEWVAEAKGGSFFEAPQISFNKENLTLSPVNVPAMIAKNAPLMRDLTHEAIEFIRQTHDKKMSQADIACVAFSGGKDSLTILDLAQRALRPDEYVVVFNDTMMEIKPTLEAVEKAKNHWPHLRFYTSRSHKRPEQTWREFGPPSRIHRWCCAVHKSVPNLLLLREIANNPAAKVLVYDGIRWEESQARAGYNRITHGGKHGTQINASPILKWNAGEIFLYLFERNIFLNTAYRYGFVRVGCSVCPMASKWWNSIVWLKFKEDCLPLLSILSDYALNEGREKEDFVSSGAWKGRAGGRNITGSAKVIETINGNSRKFIIHDPTENWFEWIKTLGKVSFTGNGSGMVSSRSFTWSYHQLRFNNVIEITVDGVKNADRYQISHLRAINQKTAYCVHCRACQVECPKGAIIINDVVKIDQEKCIHCHNCLTFEGKGCYAAKSLQITQEESNLKGINRYQHFGMREEWLNEFFTDPEIWWRKNKLGNRQFESMKIWLKECEIIANNQITDLGQTLRNIGIDNELTWLIIWANLIRNSVLIRWYANNIEWNMSITKNNLIEKLGTSLSETTRKNAITALIGLLRDTPIGSELELGEIKKIDPRTTTLIKIGQGRETHPIAVLYSLYRYAELIGRYDCSISELYTSAVEGPFRLFGIIEDHLKQMLLGLASKYSQFLAVEFVKDLDNIYVFKNYSGVDVLKNYAGY